MSLLYIRVQQSKRRHEEAIKMPTLTTPRLITEVLNTHDLRIEFGKLKGEL